MRAITRHAEVPCRHAFFLALAVSTCVISLLIPTTLSAQAKTCCNTSTGDWTTDSDEQCAAKPGHVPFAPENMALLMPCMQKTQQQAMEALGYQGIPNMPGVPPANTPPEEPPLLACCNTSNAAWTEELLAEICLSRPGHYPDAPEYLAETEICRAPEGSFDAPSEGIVINIANGGFEQWDRDQPDGFMNFDGGNLATEASRAAGVDMQTVFRSSDAHTGNYSLELRNKRTQLPPQAAAWVSQEMIPVLAGGVTTCGNNCASMGSGQAQGNMAALAVDVSEPGEYLCGVYKGSFVGGDQLWLNAVVHSGEQVIGGTNSGTGALNQIGDNSAVWKEFKLPVMMLPGSEGKSFDRATIELTLKAAGGIRSLGAGLGAVHEGTRVRIDSVRFCSGSGITLYKPRVIAMSRTAVSNADEFDIGAQTFVNLDNDDRSGKFDIDETGLGKDDNELIEMELYMPQREYGFVELRLNAREGVIRIWEDARKSKEFDRLDQPEQAPGFLEEKQGEWRKTLWIEGIQPSIMQRDIQIEFVFTQTEDGAEIESDKVALTVLGLEKIEWLGKNNAYDDGSQLDPDPNWPAGIKNVKSLRVFPGRRWAGNQPESKPRDILEVKASLNVKPVEPVEVTFRALDMDDPTAHDNEVDNESTGNDNRGQTPHYWGGFVETELDYLTVEFIEDSRAFDFQTTMQPGDNFRIVGGADVMTLMELENNDTVLHALDPASTMMIVDPHVLEATQSPADSAIREQQKYASDVLTVWRKLFLEIDSMGPVKDNETSAKITGLRSDGFFQITDAQGNVITTDRRRQWVSIDKNLFSSLPAESQSYREGYVNNFNTGTATISGSRFNTIGNTANASGNDEILLVHSPGKGVLGDAVIGQTITLVDDDHLKNDAVLPALQTSGIALAFAPAYISPEYDKSPNPRTGIPFQLHFKEDTQAYLKSVFEKGFDNASYHELEDFWVVYLLNAYQGKLNEDGDGEGGLSGQTDGEPSTGAGGYGAVVFQESGYETAKGYEEANAGTGWQMEDVAPHEIGHLFGARHEDGGLMSYDKIKTTDFKPVTLDRIRSRKNP